MLVITEIALITFTRTTYIQWAYTYDYFSLRLATDNMVSIYYSALNEKGQSYYL